MHRNTCVSVLAAGLLIGTTAAARAQGGDRGLVEVSANPYVRRGFFITGGLADGLDQYKFTDEDSYSDWQSAPSGVLRFGGAANPNLRVGGELFGWWHRYYDTDYEGDLTEYFTAFMLEAQVYPGRRSGFYLKGGIGVARSGTSSGDYGDDNGSDAFAFTVGAGYDFPLSRWVSIAPTVDLYQASFSNPPDVSGASGSYTEHVLAIGASITFQTARRHY